MINYQQAIEAISEAAELIKDFRRWVNEWEAACISSLKLKMSVLDYDHQPDGRGGAISDTSVLFEGMAGIEMAASNMIHTYRENVNKAYRVDDLGFGLQMIDRDDENATWQASRGCV